MRIFCIVETPRPYFPNIILVGGMHVQVLPTKLNEYLNEETEGVVLFSLGINTKSAEIHIHKYDNISNTLSNLEQKFLRKYENDIVENLHKSLKIMTDNYSQSSTHIYKCTICVLNCAFKF